MTKLHGIGGGQAKVEKKETKKQEAPKVEVKEALAKGWKAAPGFIPDKQSAAEFSENIAKQRENLHAINEQVEDDLFADIEVILEPEIMFFKDNEKKASKFQERLHKMRTNEKKEERKAAEKLSEKAIEEERRIVDKNRKAKIIRKAYPSNILDPGAKNIALDPKDVAWVQKNENGFQIAVRMNEIQFLGELEGENKWREDVSGRIRHKNQDDYKKYSVKDVKKEKIQNKAIKDAENLAFNLHMDIILHEKPESPKGMEKFVDAYFFTSKYGEKELKRIDEEKRELEKKIERIRDTIAGLENAETIDEEKLAEERRNLDKETANLESKKIREEQLKPLLFYLKFAATNAGATIGKENRRLEAYKKAYDQIEAEGKSAYNDQILEYLKQKIVEISGDLENKIKDVNDMQGKKDYPAGMAVLKVRDELFDLRKQMLEAEKTKDEGKIKELEERAEAIIRNFSFEPEVCLSGAEIAKPKVAQFNDKNHSYFSQKEFLKKITDNKLKKEDINKYKEAAIKISRENLRGMPISNLYAKRDLDEGIEAARALWLDRVRNEKKRLALGKEAGEVQKPAEKFLTFDEVIQYRVRKYELGKYVKRTEDNHDISGTMRFEHEIKYRKAKVLTDEMKKDAEKDAENLFKNLKCDYLRENDFTLAPGLQIYGDMYYFMQEHGEDAISERDILVEKQKIHMATLQSEEEKRQAEEVLERLVLNKKNMEALNLSFKMIFDSMLEANNAARQISILDAGIQMIKNEGNTLYHQEMIRHMEGLKEAEEQRYKKLYEDVRTVNYKWDAGHRKMKQVWIELAEIRKEMKAPGVSEEKKHELDEKARLLIYNFEFDGKIKEE